MFLYAGRKDRKHLHYASAPEMARSIRRAAANFHENCAAAAAAALEASNVFSSSFSPSKDEESISLALEYIAHPASLLFIAVQLSEKTATRVN